MKGIYVILAIGSIVSLSSCVKDESYKRPFEVYICAGADSIEFHLYECMSLENCTKDIRVVSFETANSQFKSICTHCNQILQSLYDTLLSSTTAETIVPYPTKPLRYSSDNCKDGQISFVSQEMSYAEVILFPKRVDREALGIKELKNVYGINQFFMDFDLTSGFVHPFTQSFYDRLPDYGFVMKIERSPNKVNQAKVSYITKSEVNSDDVLGQNLGFCRQWKLSEIDIVGDKIFLSPCKFRSSNNCLKVKEGSSNPYSPQIPLWTTHKGTGYVEMTKLKTLGILDGGTAAIIWTKANGETAFVDIHGSIAFIFENALSIATKYNVDPTIAICDAGSYARKFKADKNGRVDFNVVNSKTGSGQFVGAGYGYLRN